MEKDDRPAEHDHADKQSWYGAQFPPRLRASFHSDELLPGRYRNTRDSNYMGITY
jgi:hypothetical protein